MAVNLSPIGGVAGQFFDNNGNPLAGGKIYTYAAGTTTNQATYTSASGVIAHSNPIILDAAGRVPSGEIWLTDGLSYKFVIKTSTDVLIGTFDNIAGINSNFVNYTIQEEIQTATAGQTVFTLTTMSYAAGTNSLTVFVDGVNQYDGVTYAYVETNSTTVTFTAGLHVGALVKFTTAIFTPGSVGNAADVVYDPAGTGAVPTSVQAKLRETVSVKDFGAVGDGVVDDTVAIQDAIDAVLNSGGGNLYIAAGTYRTTASIYMKKGVNLIGPDQCLGNSQLFESNAETMPFGVAIIKPQSSVTTAAIFYDFQLPVVTERPYGARLLNIYVNCADQGSGDALYVLHTLSGEGAFGNGDSAGVVEIENCIFTNAPRYGVNLESTVSLKTNAYLYKCKIGFSGSHGIYIKDCLDPIVTECSIFLNGGDGLYIDGGATERVSDCDIFINDGHGITLDGFDGRYSFNNIDQNKKHGINIISVTSPIVNKLYVITGGRIGQNGTSADNTYSNIFIGDRAGVSCGNVQISNISFGGSSQVTSNRLAHIVSQSVRATQYGNYITSCSLNIADVKSGNEPFNDNFWQSCNFSNAAGWDGNPMQAKPYPFTPWTGIGNPGTLTGGTFYKTANVAAAQLYGFSNSALAIGREYWVLIDDVNTTVNFQFGSLRGNGGVNLNAPCQGKLLHCKNINGVWAVAIYG